MGKLFRKGNLIKPEFETPCQEKVCEGDIHLSDACGEINIFKVVYTNPVNFSSKKAKKHYKGLTEIIGTPYQNAVILTQRGNLLIGGYKQEESQKYINYIQKHSELSSLFKKKIN